MQKAINRFWDWIFHPSIRWYRYPKGKAAWYRYPSPGSYIKQQQVQDYKTPYEYSTYNIRYRKPVNNLIHDQQSVLLCDSAGFKVIDKLRATGYLSEAEPTQQQLQQAKRKFEEEFGFPVEKRVYRNDSNSVIFEGTNRQSYRQAIENDIKGTAEIQKKMGIPNSNRKFFKNPDPVDIESLDMFTAPHFQQTRLEVNYKLDNYANENAKRGYLEIRKGEKTFWKALDNSNDTRNVENVQRAVGDDRPTDFRLSDTRIQFQKDSKGKVVDVDPKTRSV